MISMHSCQNQSPGIILKNTILTRKGKGNAVLCRLANEPSYEYDTAFAEYRYNKNQKIKEYLKKNSKEIIQWLIGLSDEKD